uniref:Acyl carrier protein n=1 Tax=Pseudomonas phage HRDY3 TaxID=3236930 RepID=A0AB39CEP5_9VIRU
MKEQQLPTTFTSEEVARILDALFAQHPQKIGDNENPEWRTNHTLGRRLVRLAEDGARLDFLQTQSKLSYTGLSIQTQGGRTEIMWHHQRFEPQENLRRAIDLAREKFPEGQSKISPPGARFVYGRAPVQPTDPENVPGREWYGPNKLPAWHDKTTDLVYRMVSEQSCASVHEMQRVYADTDLHEWGHMDSLDHIEMIMRIEEEFGLEIPDEVSYTFRTINQIVEYVKQQEYQRDPR